MLYKVVSKLRVYKIVYWKVICGYINDDTECSHKSYYVYLKRKGCVLEKKVKRKEIYYKLLKSGGIAKVVPLFK